MKTRTLKFIAAGQMLFPDPLCDFSGIVANSRGYLRARFSFSEAWANCKKVAVFIHKGQEYPVALENNECEIPASALTGSYVQVYVVGRRPGYQINTTMAAFPQTVFTRD